MSKILDRRGAGTMLAAVASALVTIVAQPAVAATSNSLEFTGFKYGSVNVNLGAVPATTFTNANVGAYNTKIGTDPAGGTSYSYGSTFESFCIDVWQSLSFNANPDYTLKRGYTPAQNGSPYYSGTVYTERASMVGYSPKTGVESITTQVVQQLSRLYDEAHSGGHLVNAAPFTTTNPNRRCPIRS